MTPIGITPDSIASNSSPTEFKQYLRIDPGSAETIRFVEDLSKAAWGFFYYVPNPRNPSSMRRVASLDVNGDGSVDCPFRQLAKDPRPVKRFFANVIHRDAPVYETDGNGRMVKDNSGKYKINGTKDKVVIWEFGPMIARQLTDLAPILGDDNGIESVDLVVSRNGSGMQTKYQIIPKMGDSGSTEIYDDGKHDLTEFITPMSHDEVKAFLNPQTNTASFNSSGGSTTVNIANDFFGDV